MNVRCAALAATVLVAGCGGGEAALTVDLRTDLAPAAEFNSVRTEITGAAPRDHTAFRGEPYTSGVRVADVGGLAPGMVTVRVTLLDASATPVASREVRLAIDARHTVTVVITRSCVDVTCPGPGDDPALTACRGGRCADPRCLDPEAAGCRPECAADADCTATCAGTGVCAAGECLCPPPCAPVEESCNALDDDCDARVDEAFDVQTDVAHCGACGNACVAVGGTPACSAGVCGVVCNPGLADCNGAAADDGCETTLGTPADCAACGDACGGSTPLCSSSGPVADCVSSCPVGTELCGASCVDVTSDPAHCGRCSAPCDPAHAAPVCRDGACGVASCESGWADCNATPGDGCERPTTTLTDCGGCAVACAAANATVSCSTGSCRVVDCDEGWGNCDGTSATGCETSVETVTDCGACGRTCSLAHATPVCTSGACRVGSCAPGWTNEDGIDGNGCERACTGECGDANQDGDVSSLDAVRIQRYWMGLEEPTMCAAIDADVIRDGTFGQADTYVVQAMILGRITLSCIPCTDLCGDANRDGRITAADGTLVETRRTRTPATYDACEYWRFDADGNGAIDMNDSQRILDAAVGSARLACPARL